jgi:hypothetical protein
MAWEERNNSGTLSINRRKKSAKHPDYTGTIRIDGVQYWLSGWTKNSKWGDFISLSIKLKDVDPTEKIEAEAGVEEKSEEELPF